MGIFRLILAIFVVISHLMANESLAHLGPFAVFGFYLIAGYLITRVLQDVYHFKFLPFFINRFLRLYPIYYMIALATLFVILIIPKSEEYHPAFLIRHSFADWFGNLLVVPFSFTSAEFRLVPPTWSLAVEIINYGLLWCFFARSRTLALLGASLGAFYHIAGYAVGFSGWERYSPFYAAILPFCLGAVLYFYGDKFKSIGKNKTKILLYFTLTLFFTNIFACGLFSGWGKPRIDLYFYNNLILVFFIVGFLNSYKISFQFIDNVAGELSYPVFLVHWVVGLVVGWYLLDGLKRGFLLLSVSMIFIFMISFLIVKMNNRFIEPLRTKFRPRPA